MAVRLGGGAPMTAVCASSLYSRHVCTSSQFYHLIHTLFDPPPPPFLFVSYIYRPDWNATRTILLGFSDRRYRTSQQLTLIRKSNMICRLCIYNCTLRRKKIKGPGISHVPLRK
jgi:hypothetical protein